MIASSSKPSSLIPWIASVGERRHGDVIVVDPESGEQIDHCIQFADSDRGYYVHFNRNNPNEIEIVKRPILVRRFDNHSNKFVDCPPPSYPIPPDLSPPPRKDTSALNTEAEERRHVESPQQ